MLWDSVWKKECENASEDAIVFPYRSNDLSLRSSFPSRRLESNGKCDHATPSSVIFLCQSVPFRLASFLIPRDWVFSDFKLYPNYSRYFSYFEHFRPACYRSIEIHFCDVNRLPCIAYAMLGSNRSRLLVDSGVRSLNRDEIIDTTCQT